MSLDGDGDGLSGFVAIFDGATLQPLKLYTVPQSLGNFYTSAIFILGYRRFDEYKVMGLAPYGDPLVFAEMFRNCYRLLPDGDVAFASDEEKLFHADRFGLLAHIRRKGEQFAQVHKDFAAALQKALEEIALHIVCHFQRSSGERRLCLSGGVAHNCTMNGKMLTPGLFDEVFVQPAAHDAGNALGAALAVAAAEHGSVRPARMKSLFIGSDCLDEDVEKALRAWSSFLRTEGLAISNQ